MRKDLGFLKVSDYSQPFRLTRGHDDELNLTKEEIADVTTGAGVYICILLCREIIRNLYIRK